MYETNGGAYEAIQSNSKGYAIIHVDRHTKNGECRLTNNQID